MTAMNKMEQLLAVSHQVKKRIIGIMSGTSLDGVDLALTVISRKEQKLDVQLEHFITIPYPSILKEQIQEQLQPHLSSVDQICALHTDLGQFLGKTVLAVLDKWEEPPSEIDCIASHGQTLFHLPNGKNWEGDRLVATLQVGDADQIAALTGIITVSDFRMKDIAMGGEGAPLIPYVNYLLFSEPGKNRVFHNLGGISNLTYLPGSDDDKKVLAFDTGPANVLINLAVADLIDPEQHFDLDGQIAARGKTHSGLLNYLMDEPFFKWSPPKSTGRELFGETYLKKVLNLAKNYHLSSEDIIATLTSLTAHSIQDAYKRFLPTDQPIEVYFSGGGLHNQTLMQEIRTLLPHLDIRLFSELGMNPDAWEAMGFAVLANEFLSGNSVTLPGVTGCKTLTTLGKLSLP